MSASFQANIVDVKGPRTMSRVAWWTVNVGQMSGVIAKVMLIVLWLWFESVVGIGMVFDASGSLNSKLQFDFVVMPLSCSTLPV